MFSNVFGQDNSVGTHAYVKRRSRVEYSWRPPPDGWVKINVDASKRHWITSTSIGYVMRDQHSKIIMMESRRIGDCVILMAECLVVRETNIKASHKGIQWILFKVTLNCVNSINGKISIPKDIANLTTDINYLRSPFKGSRIEYCNRLVNGEVDGLAKRTHMYP